MNTPLTRYLTALRSLAAGNDPAMHEAAAMWAEYQRLLAVEARVGELEADIAELRELRRERLNTYDRMCIKDDYPRRTA